MSDSSTPFGRPTKYKPEYCQLIIEHCSKGYSIESFAGLVGVHQDTIREWTLNYPDFSASKKEAIERSRLFWETIGINHILDENIVETEGNKRISTTKKLNTGVWVFNMKNRFRWVDRHEISSDQEKPLSITLNYERNKKKQAE